MTENLSAHQFKHIYDDLGYDLAKLGCIMLSLHTAALASAAHSVIPDDALYFTKHPERFWIKGNVAHKAHVTLLYGLLRSGPEMKKHVRAVLEISEGRSGFFPLNVTIDHISYFDSPYPDDPYYCLVAHIKLDDQLLEAHERLAFLPHINTFPGYKAHITLAYIQKNEKKRDSFIARLNEKLKNIVVSTDELDYGGNH